MTFPKRHFWVRLHRYAGLTMAGLLIIVGLTGSLLAFYEELEQLLNPHWYPVHAGEKCLDLATLAERVEVREPHLRVTNVNLSGYYGGVASAWITPRIDPLTQQPYPLGYNHIILDPVTGDAIERHTWGAISEGWGNLMGFIYHLHYALALDMTGIWILGICAFIWTLDCFVGFYLTLPVRRKRRDVSQTGFWQRWLPSWKIRCKSSPYKLNFDLHRAGGLWLWAVLLMFAWSSVYMDLEDTVYSWVTSSVFDYKSAEAEIKRLPKPIEQAGLTWRQAQARGEALMAEQAQRYGFAVLEPVGLVLNRDKGIYTWKVRSDREIGSRSRRNTTEVIFDANNGELKLFLLPSGQYSGNTVTGWLYALHMANVFGLPYRIFVCLLGLAIVMLSVTGVIIWLKKRHAMRLMKIRAG